MSPSAVGHVIYRIMQQYQTAAFETGKISVLTVRLNILAHIQVLLYVCMYKYARVCHCPGNVGKCDGTSV